MGKLITEAEMEGMEKIRPFTSVTEQSMTHVGGWTVKKIKCKEVEVEYEYTLHGVVQVELAS